MALKDWEKTWETMGTITYRNKLNQSRLNIEKINDNNEYRVIINGTYQLVPIFNDVFKTKSQALTFAKSYMRTH